MSILSIRKLEGKTSDLKPDPLPVVVISNKMTDPSKLVGSNIKRLKAGSIVSYGNSQFTPEIFKVFLMVNN
jgi:hypothetical protein